MAEHERAGALIRARGDGTFRLLPMLPWFMAMNLLTGLIIGIAWGDQASGGLWMLGGMALGGAGMFCMGVGLRQLRSDPIVWRVTERGIEVDRWRRPVRIAWTRIAAVDETPEFFLVRLPAVGYYLPKRALGGPEREAEWRRALLGGVSARTGAASAAPSA